MPASNDARPAVILLSGGLDSATCLAIAQADGFAPHAISFRYGQRHLHELECARRLGERMKVVSHRIIDINLAQFGGSALTDAGIAVPKHDTTAQMEAGIPVTYVPARNTVFLSLALAMAETLGSRDIFIGVNALDYSGYPDCRPEFIESFEKTANLATKIGVEQPGAIRIHAPLLKWTKAEIIAKGISLGVDYSATNSCYDPESDGSACMRCDACLLRLKGFAENGLTDPAIAKN
ncbi:7-cyano-7-deazaguanine synthase [Roseimaritima multifibrata]|uniref:7-cyano-7-deazaguanine synthase n=1 Tax=Roseimaritima multifibrata TaxID=1930274 RepID=A0A517ML43_9BACT|nr:7-cyano-7-deazaguanine synthase QueC [Roseimaritima multifibrata]QDS95615.1 7-cyano-7-deazaguanine synthase [Roseimaritima multifibrata]